MHVGTSHRVSCTFERASIVDTPTPLRGTVTAIPPANILEYVGDYVLAAARDPDQARSKRASGILRAKTHSVYVQLTIGVAAHYDLRSDGKQ